MPKPTRPWWMLHWPSWLTLVGLVGLFMMLNVTTRMGQLMGQQSQIIAGWPSVYCHIENGNLGSRWLWTVKPPDNSPPPAYRWDWLLVVENVLSCALIVLVFVYLTEVRWRERWPERERRPNTVTAWLIRMAVVGLLLTAWQLDSRFSQRSWIVIIGCALPAILTPLSGPSWAYSVVLYLIAAWAGVFRVLSF